MDVAANDLIRDPAECAAAARAEHLKPLVVLHDKRKVQWIVATKDVVVGVGRDATVLGVELVHAADKSCQARAVACCLQRVLAEVTLTTIRAALSLNAGKRTAGPEHAVNESVPEYRVDDAFAFRLIHVPQDVFLYLSSIVARELALVVDRTETCVAGIFSRSKRRKRTVASALVFLVFLDFLDALSLAGSFVRHVLVETSWDGPRTSAREVLSVEQEQP